MNTRDFLRLILVAASSAPWIAVAQDFPSKPVKIVVPFPPGGGTDVMARALALRLQEQWNQSVVVENRSGAGGSIGAEYVYRAAPDGYTLLFTPQSVLVTTKLFNSKLAFDPDALTPVAAFVRSSTAMLVSPKVPAETLEQFITYAKANPGKLNFASTGLGSTAQLSSELFNLLAQTKMVDIPYQGVAPAYVALMAGQVDVLFDSVGNAVQNIQSGKIKVLGLAIDKRLPDLPQVPTMSEVLPGFKSPLWVGLVAPPKTPPAIAARLSQAIGEAAKHPDMLKVVRISVGSDIVESNPEHMSNLIRTEREQWVEVIKRSGLKVE